MELNEKLKEFGLSDEDLQLIESTIQTRVDEAVEEKLSKLNEAVEERALELLEQEREDFDVYSKEIVESFTTQLTEYSEVVVGKLDEKYQEKLNAEIETIEEQQLVIVNGFIDEMDNYAKSIVESLEDKYKLEFEETARAIVETYEDKLDGYVKHITTEFKSGSGSPSALKVEMAEALIESIQSVYSKYNVTIPESTNLEEEYNNFVSETEHSLTKLNEENTQLKRRLNDITKREVLSEVTSDMTIIQRDNFNSLTESLVFVSKDLYKTRLETLKEKFLSGLDSAKPTKQKITEAVVTSGNAKTTTTSGVMDVSKYIRIPSSKK